MYSPDDEPFAFDENPAAFDRTRSGKRTTEERDEDGRIYREAILRFVEEKRLEDILGQGEIASLQGYARFRTLMHGKLVNTVRVCRRAPRADCRLAVLDIIHFCADNADGLCRLSVARFAQILSRDTRNVQRAIDDLEENHEIGVHHSAIGNSYWGSLHESALSVRQVGQMKNVALLSHLNYSLLAPPSDCATTGISSSAGRAGSSGTAGPLSGACCQLADLGL